MPAGLGEELDHDGDEDDAGCAVGTAVHAADDVGEGGAGWGWWCGRRRGRGHGAFARLVDVAARGLVVLVEGGGGRVVFGHFFGEAGLSAVERGAGGMESGGGGGRYGGIGDADRGGCVRHGV